MKFSIKSIILLFSFCLFGISANSQNFEITPIGIEPVVVELDSTSSSELYKETKSWINDTYKNPEKVIVVDEEGVKIRLNGFNSTGYRMGKVYYYPYEYTLEIEFKEGRIRAKFTPTKVKYDGNSFEINFTSWYKASGELKNRNTIPKETIEEYANELLNSLIQFIQADSKNDDW